MIPRALCTRSKYLTTVTTRMESKKYEYDLQRIKKTLRKGAIERNVMTGLIVAAAASGALISTPVLVVTAGVTMGALYFANNRKKPEEQENNFKNNDLLDSNEETKQK